MPEFSTDRLQVFIARLLELGSANGAGPGAALPVSCGEAAFHCARASYLSNAVFAARGSSAGASACHDQNLGRRGGKEVCFDRAEPRNS